MGYEISSWSIVTAQKKQATIDHYLAHTSIIIYLANNMLYPPSTARKALTRVVNIPVES